MSEYCETSIHSKKTQSYVMSHDYFIQNGINFHIFQTSHNGRISKHAHEFYEIIYITDGFTLHSLGSTMNILVTGDLLFIKPGEEHSYINAYQTKLYNVLFTPDELESPEGELFSLPGLSDMFSDKTAADDGNSQDISMNARIIHVPINERRSVESALEKLVEEQNQKRTGWKCSIRSRLSSFLIRYSRMYEEQWESKSHSGGDYYGYVYQILRYIDENFSRDISMNDLSEITGLSSDYMSRKFKEVLHMPPSEYLRKFRIARAMELLCTTDLSVSEVAEKTGFSDVSLFSRVFKQAVGIPPVSYKKNAGSANSGGDIQ